MTQPPSFPPPGHSPADRPSSAPPSPHSTAHPPTPPPPPGATPGGAGDAAWGAYFPGAVLPGQVPGQVPGGQYPDPQHPGPQHPGGRGPAAGWTPAVFGGAAHKPGAIPLRPLGLGDLYDAAFKIIRFNPRATVGSAAAVAGAAMAVPVAVTAVATAVTSQAGDGDTRALGVGIGFLSFALGVLLLRIGLVLVTGMVAGVVHEAALGHVVGLSAAWVRTRGRRWRLVGLLVVQALVVVGVLVVWGLTGLGLALGTSGTLAPVLWLVLSGVFGVLPLLVFLGIRLLSLSTPALMLEDVGVVGALRRSWALSRGQFWRLFGLTALTTLISAVAGGIVAAPFSVVSGVGLAASATYGVLIYVIGQSLGNIANAALTTPFGGCVTTLLYLDQRMRKEGYDVELMAQAGLLER